MIKPLMVAAAACVALHSANVVSKETSPNQLNHPGGIVELTLKKKSGNPPVVRYGLQEPALLEQDNDWRVLIGISLEQLPGNYLVYVREDNEEETATYESINVNHKSYPLLKNSAGSVKKLQTFKTLSELDFKNSQPPSMPMQTPFEASWDLGFGTIFSNDSNQAYTQNHTFAQANARTLIKAPQVGIVCKVKKNKNGLFTVVLDHGRGIYSLLHNLDDITVELGNGVVAGAVLGKVSEVKKPSTEQDNTQTTEIGKPVYWQVQLNGVFVNPLYLINL